MSDPAETARALARARRAAALFGGLCAGLALAVVVLLVRSRPPAARVPGLLEDAERAAAVAGLVESVEGVWDAHADPDVGRVLMPDLDGRAERGALVSSNAFGMRERAFRWRKPAGTVRVVLLGDSFVFGFGVAAEERLGVVLERELAARAGATDVEIEVLHLGASSWNIIAECAFLRRQIGALSPDLVVHVVVPNDLSDAVGARGFGAMGRFSPQVRTRADGLVMLAHARQAFGVGGDNYLPYAVDAEGRARYERAAAEIAALAAAVTRTGGRYLLLARWTRYLPAVPTRLAPSLAPEQLAYVDDAFALDPDTWVSPTDAHWNPAAHVRIARLVYGLALERELLPSLALGDWPQARAEVEAIHAPGAEAAARLARFEQVRTRLPIAAELAFEQLDAPHARQVYGGIDGDGLVAPYASFVLAVDGGARVTIEGEGLARPELDGLSVDVIVEGHTVGRLEAGGASPIVGSWPLPGDITGRRFANVVLRADDYAYKDGASQRCVTFRLERVAIE